LRWPSGYEYEAEAVEAALREWAKNNDLVLDDEGNDEG
jgi:hypothetical protein